MRSMSVRSDVPRPERPMNTPSMKNPTEGSRAGSDCAVPIPRIVSRVVKGLVLEFAFRLGVMTARSLELLIPASWMVSELKAVTATGTSCRLSARFWAVTITSSRAPVWAYVFGSIPTAVMPTAVFIATDKRFEKTFFVASRIATSSYLSRFNSSSIYYSTACT